MTTALEHLINAQFHLREARTHLLAMEAMTIADTVQTALNHCGAVQRRLEKARDLERDDARRHKARIRKGRVR